MASGKSRSKVVRCVRGNSVLPLLLSCALGVTLVAGVAKHTADPIAGFGQAETREAAALAGSRAIAAIEVEHRVLADEWNDRVSSERFWSSQRQSRGASPPSSSPERFSRGRPSYLQGPTLQPGWYTPRGSSPGSWFWEDDD